MGKDGESTGLFKRSTGKYGASDDNKSASDATKPETSTKKARGSNWFQITLLVFLGLIGAFMIYYNKQLTTIEKELNADENRINKLEDVIHQQGEIIAHFTNNTVTNEDIMKSVHKLNSTLYQQANAVNQRMDDQASNISSRLSNTENRMNSIIAKAQKQIHEEVISVKSKVDAYVAVTQDQFSTENHFMLYQVAGTFVLVGCLVSFWHMSSHLRDFHEPFVQRKILAILWMCPIYSVTSWLGLVFSDQAEYFGIVKDFYEAYVIYTFLSFLIAVLGRGNRKAVVDLLAKHADHLQPPIKFCGYCYPIEYENDRDLANAVLLQCQLFAMQFVFFKPFTSVTTFVLNKANYYGAGTSATDYRSPQFYLMIIQNISVFVAFTGLLKFYHAVADDLAWCRPYPKFLTIKGVVFMTFWQGIAINLLSQTSSGTKVQENQGDQIQSFLICLEMLIFSIAHFNVFPTEEWKPGYRPKAEEHKKFGDNLALSDFLHDMKLVMAPQKKRKKKMNSKNDSTEKSALPTILDSDAGDFTDVERNDDASTIVSTNYDSDDTEIEDASKRLERNPIIRQLSSEKDVKKRLEILSIVHDAVSFTEQRNDEIQNSTMESGKNGGNEDDSTSLLSSREDELLKSNKGDADGDLCEDDVNETTNLLAS
eukprot:CAMPEP_0194368484 /NCGR_PEP_ID=MMETSP0174-20130528/16729_1 /TAXON_ID=216777 /ORGANISM="Proboscia alata, Strain PI-D3" /LENGTH=651 /DNA_ID=CAMNT_0039144885 /DNA_START=50 /DNA_END=2005 /DNA_ORIENTATION=-